MLKYIFSPDKHVGWERSKGRLVPLHDEKAIQAMLAFASDFKPDIWIEGGDNLDCGPVSHWLKDKKISLKDLDLSKDIQAYSSLVLNPVNDLMNRKGTQRYWMKGNHEGWLNQFGELHPGMASLVDVTHLLPLSKWTVVEEGDYVKLGKLHFIHGDTLKGGARVAADAVARYEHSIRFGHFHTYQVATKYSMLDARHTKTGVAVPGLCRRNPAYLEGRPNQWMQGFNYGYIHDDGTFTDYVPIIVNGRFSAEGRTYSG